MGKGGSKQAGPLDPTQQSSMPPTPTEYRSYIFRRRRPSDASVETLMMDPVIYTEFRIFAASDFSENRLAFWHDVAAFQGISAQDAEELNASALSVYDRYFQDEETCGTLGLDQATLQSIDEAFAAAGKTRDGVDKDVFNLAVGKVYEYIKSELMPKFLVSEHFRKIKTEPLIFKESGNAMDFVERGMEEKQEGKEGKETDASSNTIHLSSVFDIFPALGNPLGLSAFERFLTQSNEDTEAEDAIYVDFIFEVLDFKAATRSEKERMKRFSLIQSRYKDVAVGSIAQTLASSGGDTFGEGAVTFKKVLVAPTALDESLIEVLQYLKGKHGDAFQHSWVASITELDRRVQRTLNNVQILDNFAQERNLDVALAEIPEYTSIADLLDDSRARFYYKKYACRHFFEELVLFWMQAEEYRKGNFITCKAGSSLYVSQSDDTESIMKKRARRLQLKFIQIGSPLQINVSQGDRRQIIERIRTDDVDRQLYATCQSQIKHMLEDGSRSIAHFYTEPEGMMLTKRKKERAIKNSLKVTKTRSFGARAGSSAEDKK